MASAIVRGVFVVFPGGRCVVTTCRLEKIKLYGMLIKVFEKVYQLEIEE